MIPGLRQKALIVAPKWALAARLGMRHGSRTPVLLYHAVNGKRGASDSYDQNLHNVFPEVFAEQVSIVKRYYEIVFVDELFERVRSGKSVAGLAAITFDDGYESVLSQALPILKREGAPSTLFISTNLPQQKIFWRDRVRLVIRKNLVVEFLDFAGRSIPSFRRISPESFYRDTKNAKLVNSKHVDGALQRFLEARFTNLDTQASASDAYIEAGNLSGADPSLLKVGNHTVNHYVLSSLTPDEQASEIDAAQSYIRSLGFQESKLFSIPFGGTDDYNQATLRIIKDLGFEGYLLSKGHVNTVNEIEGQLDRQPALWWCNRFMPRNGVKGFLWQLAR